ncbi:MAG TPA: PilZ domain-containing protein [Terriglobales bacterium]|nr:PilZ domain-containing protein [Terriglobales bacterium]
MSERGTVYAPRGTSESLVNTRRWKRYKLDVPVRVIVHTRMKTKIVDARGNELNEGGLCIAAGVELQIGDRVDVEFTPPYSGEPVRARADVKDRNGYSYGMEFVVLDSDDIENVMQIRAALQGMGKLIT